jgi:hypothetical protein
MTGLLITIGIWLWLIAACLAMAVAAVFRRRR